jgi:hypothetical protein
MTRKSPAKKPKAAKRGEGKAKAAGKPARPRRVRAYVVVREVPAEVTSYTEPECVFASKSAALKLATERNREIRALTNPFERCSPEYAMTGGEKALFALLKKLRLTAPKKDKTYHFVDWEEWWDRAYFDITDAQRAAIWDALDKFDWYRIRQTTVE